MTNCIPMSTQTTYSQDQYVAVPAAHKSTYADNRTIQELIEQVEWPYFNSVTSLISPSLVEKLVDEVDKIFEDHQIHGWDGYEANPISEISKNNIICFFKLFNNEFVRPVILPNPMGHISLYWRDNQYSIIVSMDSSNNIHYSIHDNNNPNNPYYYDAPFNNIMPTDLNHYIRKLNDIKKRTR